jgi:hypothetical protein
LNKRLLLRVQSRTLAQASLATRSYRLTVTFDPQWRVLTDAFDGAYLYELLLPVINAPNEPLTRIEPALTPAGAISAVREALISGDIYLCDVTQVRIPLDRDEALALIEDERIWDVSRSPRLLLLNLTDKGEETLASFGRHS